MKKIVVPIVVAVLVATGCSANADEPAVVEGEGMDLPTWVAADGPGVFVCTGPEAQGVVYTISLPADREHEAIRRVEELRADIETVTEPGYVLVEVDATQAGPDVARASVYQLQWATAEQESGTSRSVSDVIEEEWREQIPMGHDRLKSRARELGNDLRNTGPNRGAKGWVLVVGDEPVESMVAPMLMPDMWTMIPCELA